MKVTEREVLGVLDMLYEGMLDDQVWPRALQAAADLVSGSAIALFSINPTTGQVWRADVARIDPNVMPAYQGTWINQDPRHAASLMCPVGQPQVDGMLMSTRTFHHSAVFNEFLKPADIPYHLATWIERRPERGVVLTIQGSMSRGAFTETERQRMQLLIPHFRRIVELKDRLAFAQLKADTLLDTLERLPFGLLLLANSLEIPEASAASRRLLALRDGLHADHGHLGFVSQESERAFATHLKEDPMNAALAETILVKRPGGRPPLSLLTLPVKPGQEHWLRPAARWLVLVFDPESAPDLPEHVLQKALGISTAEAALARLLAIGMSVSQASEHLGVSRNTARAQLKSIYAKTGHNTQAKLVARILTSPALLAGLPGK